MSTTTEQQDGGPDYPACVDPACDGSCGFTECASEGAGKRLRAALLNLLEYARDDIQNLGSIVSDRYREHYEGACAAVGVEPYPARVSSDRQAQRFADKAVRAFSSYDCESCGGRGATMHDDETMALCAACRTS